MDLLALAFVAASGFTNLIGGYIAVRMVTPSQKTMNLILAGVAGFLLAATFIGLIPEVGAKNPTLLGIVFVGYLFVYLAENLFPAHAHHHHPEGDHTHDSHGSGHDNPRLSTAAGWMANTGLAIHAFFDGIALYGAFQAGLATGLLLFLAITLHKLPVGFSVTSVMRMAQFPIRTAFLASVLLFVATTLGGITALGIGRIGPTLQTGTLAFAAGAIIYIGATDMIPATHAGGSRSSLAASLTGVTLFYLSFLILRSYGLG